MKDDSIAPMSLISTSSQHVETDSVSVVSEEVFGQSTVDDVHGVPKNSAAEDAVVVAPTELAITVASEVVVERCDVELGTMADEDTGDSSEGSDSDIAKLLMDA